MRTSKREEVNGRWYRELAQAQAWMRTSIKEVYNRQRLHSAQANLAPEAY